MLQRHALAGFCAGVTGANQVSLDALGAHAANQAGCHVAGADERDTGFAHERFPVGQRLGLPIVAGAKEGSADPHPGRALCDRGLQVVAHAHGERVQRQAELRLQRADRGERSILFVAVIGGFWNGHQAAQRKVGQRVDGLGECWQVFRAAAGFAGFATDVDLNADVQRRSEAGQPARPVCRGPPEGSFHQNRAGLRRRLHADRSPAWSCSPPTGQWTPDRAERPALRLRSAAFYVMRSCMDITELLAFSAKQGASDLHLSAGLPPMIRVDGDVRRINLPALDQKEVQALIYDIMNDKQRKDFEEDLETDFSFEVPGVARFRVNAFNQNRGAGAVFRTIPSKVLSMEELGMGEVFRKITDVPRGLVLVTGPTGSGKSTTLAAMVDYLNSNKHHHILTIEDPIEFVHESKKSLINQREVHRDTHGFAEALRSALREDPDVILVGELRDLETIRLALTAAETGHLVFGTLHTTSAAKSIDRIVDVFPAQEKSMIRSMLSESLHAIVSQALLKKVGGGRVAAHEIMIGTSAIRNLIREDKVAQMYSSIQTGGALGMQTLDMCLKDLISKGLITRESAREKAKTPDSF
nr:hypothetical protein [Tanacetum cinerariifolium]